jgi:hypothetical protein
MSNAKSIIASGLVEIGVNNLDLYIPRISEKCTEDYVKIMFANTGIGMVDYVDFVATKNPETKEIQFYSAFMRLREWNPDGYWYNLIIVQKQNKIQVSKSEFWIILPAKTPLSRSKVNTHQLAAYTDELYVRVEAIEKSAVENVTVSSTHFQNLLAKSEAQAAQIEQLLKIVAEQSNQLTRINEFLFQEKPVTKQRALTIEDLAADLPPVQCEDNWDRKKEERMSPVYCDDECFFFKPLANKSPAISPTNQKVGIISGTFSCDLDDLLYPAAKSCGISKEEARKAFEEEYANSQRVKGSINYCGNE